MTLLFNVDVMLLLNVVMLLYRIVNAVLEVASFTLNLSLVVLFSQAWISVNISH